MRRPAEVRAKIRAGQLAAWKLRRDRDYRLADTAARGLLCSADADPFVLTAALERAYDLARSG